MSLVGSRVLGSVNKLLSLSLSTTATKPCAAVSWVKSVTWSLRGSSEAGVYHEVPKTPQVQALRLDLGTTSGSHAFARFCFLVKRKQLGNLSPEDPHRFLIEEDDASGPHWHDADANNVQSITGNCSYPARRALSKRGPS